MEFPGDNDASPTGRGLAMRLFLVSFAALFLELMVIRWVPSMVRFVAYYANLMLISSFLGLGIGAMLSRRGWNVFRWFPPLLAANVAAILACRHVGMPGSGNELRFYVLDFPALGYVALVIIFGLNTALFVPFGERIGSNFQQLPPLRAYCWDLVGSLCGTLAFSLFSLGYFSPALGMAGVMLIYLALASGAARLASAAWFAAVLAAVLLAGERGAVWSPYYYITVHEEGPQGRPILEPPANLRTMKDPPIYSVSVNQDFYQQHGTIDLARYTPDVPRTENIKTMLRSAYLLPYQLRLRRSGAGHRRRRRHRRGSGLAFRGPAR